MNLKLNYKRTALIGFAFFGICLLWQVYDSWCPTLLTDVFNRAFPGTETLEVQWLVGIIMACDNLAALILLPIFGNLSDKTKSPIGKRMPYILIGTFVSAVVFPFIPLFFHLGKVVGMVICMGLVLLFMMMYRNPAVSLMPDITPKPLRAKANGIINIMGYFGGAFAVLLGIGVLSLSNYIRTPLESRNLWVVEAPFLVASVLMVASALVLFFTIKENKLAEELKDELDLGEKMSATTDAIEEDKPLSKANRIMLFGILGAEFLWFMADNGIGTYLGNYVIYHLQASSGAGMLLTVAMGVASIAGFAIAGGIADKIGRKWTITLGLSITLIGFILMVLFIKPTEVWITKKDIDGNDIVQMTVPSLLYVIWGIKGFGMSLVHNCSFPMVVELSSKKTIGKFTGFYYAASMAAQTVTPVLLGLLFLKTGKWEILPIYATVLYALALVVFVLIVKNVKAKKVANVKGLEAIGGDD